MAYYSVQFMGKDATLQAFQNSDCCNWSVLQGKQFMFKYEGTERAEAYATLSELLKMISNSSGSEAVYTLRTYDYPEEKQTKETKDGKQISVKTKKRKIYESTPFDGSFNFKIFATGSSPQNQEYNEIQILKGELAEFKKVLAEFLADRTDDGKDEKLSGIAGVLNSLVEMPEVKAAIAGKVVDLFNGVSQKIGSYMQPRYPVAKIAGTEEMTVQPRPAPGPTIQPIQLPQDQVDKLNYSLTALVKLDPDFAEHLYKLCQIAQNDPGTYQMLISMLNKK